MKNDLRKDSISRKGTINNFKYGISEIAIFVKLQLMTFGDIDINVHVDYDDWDYVHTKHIYFREVSVYRIPSIRNDSIKKCNRFLNDQFYDSRKYNSITYCADRYSHREL